MKTVKQLLDTGIAYLNKYNIDNPFMDCQLLLMKCLKWDKVKLLTHLDDKINKTFENEYIEYVKERANGKPIQYIIGYKEFMGLNFYVNENVLIPRPDTEILVESVMRLYDKSKFDLIMDIGTGSGCIPISICNYVDKVNAIAIDISNSALELAQRNALLNNQCEKISFVQSNLFNSIPKFLNNSVDVIISNPPYIPSNDIPTLMKDVKDYEPNLALDGGNDGLDFYRKIISEGKNYLKNGGYLFFEVGYNQAKLVMDILKMNKYNNIGFEKDLAGYRRVVYAQKI